jgi:hypothetical protein
MAKICSSKATRILRFYAWLGMAMRIQSPHSDSIVKASMQPIGTIERVLVYPRSGYSNRLQAMASAAILANRLGADFRVCWETEDVVPDGPEMTFGPGYCAAVMVTAEHCRSEWGIVRQEMPRYFHSLPEQGLIVLAGHDRGEQVFMPQLRAALATASPSTTLVVIAGGQFFLDSDASPSVDWRAGFRRERHEYYSHTPLNPAIESAARGELNERARYIGLHLRYTDRAHQTPFDGEIREALQRASQESGLHDVFVATDNRATREKWSAIIAEIGMRPWSVDHGSWDRSVSGSGHAALVDWRILTRAERLVYFAESTFAEEAAVASRGYDSSFPLAANALRSTLVRAQEFARNVVTYPRRRGWLGPS